MLAALPCLPATNATARTPSATHRPHGLALLRAARCGRRRGGTTLSLLPLPPSGDRGSWPVDRTPPAARRGRVAPLRHHIVDAFAVHVPVATALHSNRWPME